MNGQMENNMIIITLLELMGTFLPFTGNLNFPNFMVRCVQGKRRAGAKYNLFKLKKIHISFTDKMIFKNGVYKNK
jgi:hypothetical protein